jgi:hypothetical protein
MRDEWRLLRAFESEDVVGAVSLTLSNVINVG